MSQVGNYHNAIASQVATAVREAYEKGQASRDAEISLLKAKIQLLEEHNRELKAYIHSHV
jgi:hypothetical protein